MNLISNSLFNFLSKKDEILKQKFKEKVGFELTIEFLEMEVKKEFCRITQIVSQDGINTYYWNDGIKEKLRIVSFYPYNPLFEGTVCVRYF